MATVWTLAIVAITLGGLVYAFAMKRYVSLVLILILVADAGVALVMPRYVGGAPPIELLFSPPYFWAGSQPQTILLSVFVHVDIFHILFNCISLYFFGTLLEERRGGRVVLLAFLVPAVLANLVYAAVKPSEPAFLLGASGGIMGIIGALARLHPHDRTTIFGFGLILPNVEMWVAAAAFAAIDLTLALVSEFTRVSMFGSFGGVAYIAHLAGLAIGLLLAPLFARLSARPEAKRVAVSGIERLVPGEKGKEIAAALKGESEPDVVNAWLKRVEEVGKCPECGAKLRLSGDKFRCERGHVHRIGR